MILVEVSHASPQTVKRYTKVTVKTNSSRATSIKTIREVKEELLKSVDET